MAQDFTALMAVWGQVLTVVRRSAAYSDTGTPTVTWTSVDTPTGMIQPYLRRGDYQRSEAGIKSEDLSDIYVPKTTVVNTADRVRPFGWAAGQDEYEVINANDYSPSHYQLLCQKVRGHGG